MFLTVVLFSIAAGLLYLIFRSRRRAHNLFNELGIPGPKPNLIFGNLHSVAGKMFVNVLQEWTKEYGSIYGYYEGSAPVIVTSDPDVIKDVFIKQFNSFYGRRLLPVQPEPDTGTDKDVHIFLSRGHRWRRLRSTISPSFSKSKLKQMLPLIKTCVDETMEILEKKSSEGKAFDIHRVLQGLTIDVIGTCAFGLEPHFQKNRDNDPFIRRCQRLFTDFAKRPFIVILGAIFPEFSGFWWKLCKLVASYTYDDMDWLFTNLGIVIDQRKKSFINDKPISKYEKPVDLLQILLDAEVGSNSSKGNSVSHLVMHETEEDYNCNYEPDNNFIPEMSGDSSVNYLKSKLQEVFQKRKNETEELGSCTLEGVWSFPESSLCEKQNKRLSMDEVKATSVVFLIGGYETISNLLAYVVYELAMNPECQKKLQAELDEAFPEEVVLCYDKLAKLRYLEMVISETLRMYPISSLLTGRLCMKTAEVKGITIPEGTMVQPDVWSLHYNPKFWGPVDPRKFHPERFTPENKANRHPMAYLPFGAGPKNCVGMRFALTECKLTLSKLFKKFDIINTEQTICELVETAALSPKNGITVKLLPRSR